MPNRPQIECDVHDLLDEANVMLLMHAQANAVADDLIKRLKYCADRATADGRPEITHRLNRAAEMLTDKLGPISNVRNYSQ